MTTAKWYTRLKDVMWLFSKKKEDEKLLELALEEYKKGDIDSCVKYIDEAIKHDSGREYFFKTIIELSDSFDGGKQKERFNDDHNDLIFKEVMNSVSNWAKLGISSSSYHTYTIGNKTYTKCDYRYLYDELGIRSEYRIDDIEHLYDGNGNDLGYFNYQGIFIDK